MLLMINYIYNAAWSVIFDHANRNEIQNRQNKNETNFKQCHTQNVSSKIHLS
jgi:hypothetical protein